MQRACAILSDLVPANCREIHITGFKKSNDIAVTGKEALNVVISVEQFISIYLVLYGLVFYFVTVFLVIMVFLIRISLP